MLTGNGGPSSSGLKDGAVCCSIMKVGTLDLGRNVRKEIESSDLEEQKQLL